MRNTAYAFAADVDREIESFSRVEFLGKKGRCKRLREEVYPISRLALHFKQPGLEVKVEAFEDSGEADGHISISGFTESEFDVQVSFIFDYYEALRDELLVEQGFAPGSGEISRDKSGRIVAIMQCTSDEITPLYEAIIERLNKKKQKNYTSKMVLIIAFEDMKFVGRTAWKNLFTRLDHFETAADTHFISGYLINCASNEVYRWF
jgi:hypothetical protein